MNTLRSAHIGSLLLLLGCSDPADALPDAALDDAGTPRDAEARDAAVDASSDDASIEPGPIDGGGRDGAAPDAGSAHAGLVSLTQSEAGGVSRYVLHGYFVASTLDDLRGGLLSGCTLAEESGACRRLDCDGSLDVTHGAGVLRASVAGDPPVSATVSASLGQYLRAEEGRVFEPGDVVRFEGSGDVVPAFSADVVAPEPSVVALPATISRAAPLVIAWGATTAETMQISLVPTVRASVIRCLAPAAGGSITIDAAMLDDYAAGTNIMLSTSAFSSVTIDAGAYEIAVSVGQGSSATATIE